jgi:rubrerythrin
METTNGLRSATKEDVLTALRTEAYTYARSMLFAAAARKNGRTEIADLFESTARTELEEHFAMLADLAGIVGDDADNLRAAIEAESYEIEVMYPTFAEHATRASDTAAAECFAEIRRHEVDHLEALREALIDIT